MLSPFRFAARTAPLAAWSLLAGGLVIGCSGPAAEAFDNRVFYERDIRGASARELMAFEQHYPPLDSSEPPTFMGVAVLDGKVRLSRPRSWRIRSASGVPSQRFIEYISPSQILFSIYERIESPQDPWRAIMGRYEEEVQSSGGKLLSKAMPGATWNAQARVYTVERRVAAPKAAFVNKSREYLLRSDQRVVLVQIVHQGDDTAHVEDELLRAVSSLQVL